MRLSRRLLLAAAALPAGFAAAPAAACTYSSTTVCLGDGAACDPTPRERAEQERGWSAQETRRRLIEGKAKLRAGEVNLEAELAELLVPNIRPVAETLGGGCGRDGEVDYGGGRATGDFERLVAGTPLAGSDPARFEEAVRRSDLFSLEPACNSEFRHGFAQFLADRVDERHLREAWLFLRARQRTYDSHGSLYHRAVRFEGDRRAPPVLWTGANPRLSAEVRRAIRRTIWGRSLASAVEDFWARAASRLNTHSTACPDAAARWASARERLLAEMMRLNGAGPR